MTSTESSSEPVTLPLPPRKPPHDPLPGQLPARLPVSRSPVPDTIEQALRARRRRVQAAEHAGKTLAALAVSDNRIDQALRSIAVLAGEARELLDAKLAAAAGPAFDDAAFLRLALAIQSKEPGWLRLVEQLHGRAPRAVRDALWFFPASLDTFPLAADHVVELFWHALERLELLPLALELVGRCDLRHLANDVRPLTHSAEFSPLAHWVLLCLDAAGEPTERFLCEGLLSEDRDAQVQAMAMVRVAPHLPHDEWLMPFLGREEPFWAWPVMVARHPRRLCDMLAQHTALSEEDRLRVLAVGGYLDCVVEACRGFAAQPDALTPEQADLLMLTLGEVPMEALVRPNDIHAKAQALRAALLRVCRRLHIGVTNDADRCAWDVEQIFSEPAKARAIRLREGRVHSSPVPNLGTSLTQLTHPLRQWLYIERAVAGGHVLTLDALDVCRRQMLALTVSDFLHELQAG